MKECSKCKEHKTNEDFYKDKRTKDGLKSQCKKCHTKTSITTRNVEKAREANKKYMRRAVAKNPQKYRKQWRKYSRVKDEKTYARMVLNSAIRSGIVMKPILCQECKRKIKLTAHHDNYDEPLCVEWLCYECHAKRHRKVS